MEKQSFAPVLIPTLNRFEHLKRCIESLERCSGAENTDVFVALDYPPTKKYVDGWKKTDAYLKEKELNHRFKNLFVHRRESNCGIGHPNDNLSQLVKEVCLVSEVYIMTEDDNEFAPNFLEYINWGLNEFKEDLSIFAICGCKDIDTHDIQNNVYKLNTIFNAWGYGTWFNRREKLDRLRDHKVLMELVHQTRLVDIFSSKVLQASSLLYQIAKKTFHGDVLVSLLPKEEKWCVFPKVNMVRNWGWDGTGTHGGSPEALKKYSTLPIDKDEHFTPIIVENLFNPVVLERFYQCYKTSTKSHVRAALTFLCYKLTGCIPVANKKSKWCKVKLLKVQ